MIVGNVDKDTIIHIKKISNNYTLNQKDVDYKEIANDLGIKVDDILTSSLSTSRFLFLVEGISDVIAMQHNAEIYKAKSMIQHTFEELNINIIPIGGCGAIKHWQSLDLLTKLGKPFFIFLDSDKETFDAISPNEKNLIEYGLAKNIDFIVSKKRLIENYIPATALMRLVPECLISYTDFEHAKKLCKNYPDSKIRAKLGGGDVIEKHYKSLTFDELRKTWYDGSEDEFILIHNTILSKLNQNSISSF